VLPGLRPLFDSSTLYTLFWAKFVYKSCGSLRWLSAMPTLAYSATLNNYTEDDVATLRNGHQTVSYLICGHEVGELETPHLQIYFQLDRQVKITTIKRWGGPWARMHFETSRGSDVDNYAYCIKDGSFWEIGERRGMPGKGTRMDLISLQNDIKIHQAHMRLSALSEQRRKNRGVWRKYRGVWQKLEIQWRKVGICWRVQEMKSIHLLDSEWHAALISPQRLCPHYSYFIVLRGTMMHVRNGCKMWQWQPIARRLCSISSCKGSKILVLGLNLAQIRWFVLQTCFISLFERRTELGPY
jgi:hypothetical protein